MSYLSTKPNPSPPLTGTLALFYGMKCYSIPEPKTKAPVIAQLNDFNYVLGQFTSAHLRRLSDEVGIYPDQ